MAEKQALNATFFAFKKRERGGVLGALREPSGARRRAVRRFRGAKWQRSSTHGWQQIERARGAGRYDNPFEGASRRKRDGARRRYGQFMMAIYMLLRRRSGCSDG